MGSELVSLGQFKVGEVKAWGHSAAHQAPWCSGAGFCGEPTPGWHHMLRLLALGQVHAEVSASGDTAGTQFMHNHRAAPVSVPDLIGVDPMPMGAFARLQQKQDGRARGPRAPRSHHLMLGSVGLAEMPSFWMGLETQLDDQLSTVTHRPQSVGWALLAPMSDS